MTFKPDYWDGVRTGENDGEVPWPLDTRPCGEWQCKLSHEACANAGRCLNDTHGVVVLHSEADPRSHADGPDEALQEAKK